MQRRLCTPSAAVERRPCTPATDVTRRQLWLDQHNLHQRRRRLRHFPAGTRSQKRGANRYRSVLLGLADGTAIANGAGDGEFLAKNYSRVVGSSAAAAAQAQMSSSMRIRAAFRASLLSQDV